MYVKVKQFTEKYPWSVPVIIILVCLSCVWVYTNRSSNIDTSGIRNAENELRHVREYNKQSIDYNQRVRNAVESSQAINQRTEERINRSVELNQRTENSIDRSTELTSKARADLEQQKKEIHKAKMEQRKSKLLNILLGGTVVYLAAKN